jgi:hypothetical protein
VNVWGRLIRGRAIVVDDLDSASALIQQGLAARTYENMHLDGKILKINGISGRFRGIAVLGLEVRCQQ